MLSAFHGYWKKKRPAPLLSEARTAAILELTGPEVKTEADARRALARLIRRRAKKAKLDGPASFETYDWQEARKWLLEWLPQIRGYASASELERENVRTEINARLYIDNGLQVQVGEFGLEYAAEEHDSAWAAAVVAVVPFIISEGWPPTRLAQCRYRNCGRWFLRPPARRGTVAEYCSRSHASTERVMRFRDNEREAATKSSRSRQ